MQQIEVTQQPQGSLVIYTTRAKEEEKKEKEEELDWRKGESHLHGGSGVVYHESLKKPSWVVLDNVVYIGSYTMCGVWAHT